MRVGDDGNQAIQEDQDRVATALQQCNAHSMPEGSLLTGWVVVAEFMDPNGEKWLSRLNNSGAAKWFSGGLLHYGLYNMGDDE